MPPEHRHGRLPAAGGASTFRAGAGKGRWAAMLGDLHLWIPLATFLAGVWLLLWIDR